MTYDAIADYLYDHFGHLIRMFSNKELWLEFVQLQWGKRYNYMVERIASAMFDEYMRLGDIEKAYESLLNKLHASGW